MNTFLLLFIVVAGALLLYYLDAGRVPPPIKPVANAWSRAGYDQKWITAALWGVFCNHRRRVPVFRRRTYVPRNR